MQCFDQSEPNAARAARYQRNSALRELCHVLQIACDAIELGRHDEVILVQPFYLLRFQRNRRVAPAKTDLRVMTLRLGQFGNVRHESERLAEVLEPVSPLDPGATIRQRPLGHLQAVGFGLLDSQRRDTTAARCADLLCENAMHRVLLQQTAQRLSEIRSALSASSDAVLPEAMIRPLQGTGHHPPARRIEPAPSTRPGASRPDPPGRVSGGPKPNGVIGRPAAMAAAGFVVVRYRVLPAISICRRRNAVV